jgi:hypothetical protein
VRDPASVDTTIWVDADALKMADGVDKLPVSGCGELAVQTPTPTPTPTPTATQTKPPAPPAPPAGDTTKPVMGNIQLTPFSCTITVTTTATDNVGVTAVNLAWSGATTGNAAMNHVGNNWTYTIAVPSGTNGIINISASARDAAGNISSPAQSKYNWQGCVIG